MRNLINTTGYTKGEQTENNPINIIPGNHITMKNVNKTLALVPIVGGKPQYNQKVIARPGDPDIKFDQSVEAVLELPTAQVGIYTSPIHNFDPNSQNPYILEAQGKKSNPWTQQGVILPADNIQPIMPQGVISPAHNTQPVTQQGVMLSADDVQPVMPQKLGNTQLVPKFQQKANPVEETKNQDFEYLSAANPYTDISPDAAMYHAGAAFGKGGDELFGKTGRWFVGIGGLGKAILSSARNFTSGLGVSNRVNEARKEEAQRKAENLRKRDVYYTQKGGPIGFLKEGGFANQVKEMTGNFVEGQDDNPMGNTLVEQGEFIQFPGGETAEVLGDRHSSETRGELLNLPAGTKVISDYLQIGGKNAKKIKKDFDINVKATNKYATVLSNFRKKIGLEELIEEEEAIIKKIAKQEEVEHKPTRDLNLQVLGDKLRNIQDQKDPLELQLSAFTDYLFEIQEESKQKNPNQKKQEGGEVGDQMVQVIQAYSEATGQPIQQVIDRLDSMPDNEKETFLREMVETVGMPQQNEVSNLEEIVLTFAQQNGLDPNEVLSKISQLSPEEKEQAILEMTQEIEQTPQQGPTPEDIIIAFAEKEGITPEEIVQQLQQLTEAEQQQALEQMVMELQGSEPQAQGSQPEMMKEGGEPGDRRWGVSEETWNMLSEKQKEEYIKALKDGTYGYDAHNNALNSWKSQADYEYLNLPEEIKRIKEFAKEHGYSVPDGIDNYNQEQLDNFAGVLQKHVIENDPELARHYGLNNAPTRDGVQYLLDKGLLDKSKFRKELYQDFSNGKIRRGTKEQSYTEEELKYIRDTIDGIEDDNLKSEYATTNFNDKKWYYRYPSKSLIPFLNKDDFNKYGTEYNIVSEKSKFRDADKTGKYTKELLYQPLVFETEEEKNKWVEENKAQDPLGKGFYSKEGDNTFYMPFVKNKANQEEPEEKPENVVPEYEKAKKQSVELPMFLPDQSNLPPTLQVPTMRSLRHVQADPIAVSPTRAIENILNESSVAREELSNSNPYTSAASKALLNTQTFKAINEAESQANMQNYSDQRNVDNINEQRQYANDQFNLGQKELYENKMIRTFDNFAAEQRNYIDRVNRERVSNFNTQNQMNLYNALNPNYKMDALGRVKVQDTAPFSKGYGWIEIDGKYYRAFNGKKVDDITYTKDQVDSLNKARGESKIPSLASTPLVPTVKQEGGIIKQSLKNFLNNYKFK